MICINACKCLLLFLNTFAFTNGLANLSGEISSRLLDNEYHLPQLNTSQKEGEWNMEYNYGRSFMHSEGQQWATVLNNHYDSKSIDVPMIFKHSDEPEPYKQQPVMSTRNLETKTGNGAKSWYNWLSTELNWSDWILMKENYYMKQPTSWWNLRSQQNSKMPKTTWSVKQEEFSGPGEEMQPFWPGSIGWTGDLGELGEIPPIPWYSYNSTS